MSDVEHPNHYTSHPSGVECVEVVKHFNFLRGSAIKYVWRAGLKGNAEDEIRDLEKAREVLRQEVERLRTGVTPEAERKSEQIPLEDLPVGSVIAVSWNKRATFRIKGARGWRYRDRCNGMSSSILNTVDFPRGGSYHVMYIPGATDNLI